MKIFCFRYPRNTVTDVLVSLLCLFVIILIVTNGKTVINTSADISQDVTEFIESHGYVVDKASRVANIRKIPEYFDKVYSDYNEIQLEQGFDLSAYKGKTVCQYTYPLLNFPGFEDCDNIYVNVMVYDGNICAADICCASVNGFITGVVKNELN